MAYPCRGRLLPRLLLRRHSLPVNPLFEMRLGDRGLLPPCKAIAPGVVVFHVATTAGRPLADGALGRDLLVSLFHILLLLPEGNESLVILSIISHKYVAVKTPLRMPLPKDGRQARSVGVSA